MAKKKSARKKPSKKTKSSTRKLELTEMGGEAFDLIKPGEVRRRHQASEDKDLEPGFFTIDQKFNIIDALLSKLTTNTSCDEIDVLRQHVQKWAAELGAVHRPDVNDDQIHDARIFFPTDSIYRLLKEMIDFQHRAQIDEESAVDFVLMKLHGDSPQSAFLN